MTKISHISWGGVITKATVDIIILILLIILYTNKFYESLASLYLAFITYNIII